MKTALLLLACVIGVTFAAPASHASKIVLAERAPVATPVPSYVKRNESASEVSTPAAETDLEYLNNNASVCIYSTIAANWLRKVSPEARDSLASLGLGPYVAQTFIEPTICFFPFQCIDLDIVYGYGVNGTGWRSSDDDGIHYINRSSFDPLEQSWCKVYQGNSCKTEPEFDAKNLTDYYNADEVPLNSPVSMKCGITCDPTEGPCPKFDWDASLDHEDANIDEAIEELMEEASAKWRKGEDEKEDYYGGYHHTQTPTPSRSRASTSTSFRPLLPSATSTRASTAITRAPSSTPTSVNNDDNEAAATSTTEGDDPIETSAPSEEPDEPEGPEPTSTADAEDPEPTTAEVDEPAATSTDASAATPSPTEADDPTPTGEAAAATSNYDVGPEE